MSDPEWTDEELERKARLREIRADEQRRQDNAELLAAIRKAARPDSRWARAGLPPLHEHRGPGNPGDEPDEALARRFAAAVERTAEPKTWDRIAMEFYPRGSAYGGEALRKLAKRRGLTRPASG